jgi:peptidoglycan/LPS O-acetylase OafA/YrhL
LLISILKLRHGLRIAFWTALAIAAIAALWRLILTLQQADAMRLYNGFDTRCDSVLVGCALVFVAPRLQRFWPLGVAGLIVVLAYFPWYDPLLFKGGYTLIAVSAALVIAGALNPQTYIARALSLRPLVGIGRRSYGLYLYHFPIYMVIGLEVGRSPFYLNTIGLGTTAVVAALSYRYVESRCLEIGRQPRNWWRDRSLAYLGPASLTIGAIYIVWTLANWPNR